MRLVLLASLAPIALATACLASRGVEDSSSSGSAETTGNAANDIPDAATGTDDCVFEGHIDEIRSALAQARDPVSVIDVYTNNCCTWMMTGPNALASRLCTPAEETKTRPASASEAPPKICHPFSEATMFTDSCDWCTEVHRGCLAAIDGTKRRICAKECVEKDWN